MVSVCILLCFPTILFDKQVPAEGRVGTSHCPDVSAPLANASMVCKDVESPDRQASSVVCDQRSPFSSNERQRSSTGSKTSITGMQAVRKQFIDCDVPEAVADVLMSSWRSGTQKQYDTYIRKWCSFCVEEKINSLHPNVTSVLKFLHSLHVQNLAYSTLNTARSALSSFLIGFKFGGTQYGMSDHPLIVRYMKGVFNLCRPTPRYVDTWDIQPVLNYLELLFPLDKLSLKELSLKLVMLLALTSGQRCQTLTFLDTQNMSECADGYVFLIKDHVKQDRPGKLLSSVVVKKYAKQELCVYSTLQHYLNRTQLFRKEGNTRLLLSYVKPFHPITASTVGRWIKCVLDNSGIDTKKFKAHSTRAASTSKASQMIPIDQILQHIGWSREGTFQTFYNKPIYNNVPFDKAVLK